MSEGCGHICVFVGWSSSSSQLTSNLHMLRLKAEMATKLEKKTKDCTAALDTYHQHLTAPLPHSVSLHKCQFQWKEKEVCEKTVYTLACPCVYLFTCTCVIVYIHHV